jgi:hypothetical protein
MVILAVDSLLLGIENVQSLILKKSIYLESIKGKRDG